MLALVLQTVQEVAETHAAKHVIIGLASKKRQHPLEVSLL